MRKNLGESRPSKERAAKSGAAPRKKDREPLRASEKKYRTLFEGMVQGAFFQAADGRLIDVNPKALQLSGLSRQEFLRRTSLTPSWNIIREDGSTLPADEHPSMVALKKGHPVKDRIAGIFNARTKACSWVIINAIPQFRSGERMPFQVYVTLHDITWRKQAEEQLLLFKESVEGSSDAIGMSTPEGIHYYQNRAFDELFGDIGADAPAGLYVSEEAGREVFTTIIAGGQWSGEVEMHAKDGSAVNILLRAYANKDRSGRIIGLVGIHTDITQRKRDEEALRQSQERYRLLMDAAPDAIIIVNRQGRIVSWNRGAEKIYGYTADRMLGKHCRLLVPERFRKRQDELIALAREKGGPVSSTAPLEGCGLRKDGAEFIVEMTFNMFLVNNEPFFTSIMRDISERRQIEKRLHESEELFRLSFENAPIGIAVFDKKGELLKANIFCEQYFGCSRKDFLQQGLALFLHPDDGGPDPQAFVADHAGLKKPTVLENRFFADDGRVIYTKQYIRGVFDTADTLSFIIVLSEDITAAKQLSLMGSAVINKLKDVHCQIKEFCNMLPEEQKFLKAKSLSDYGLSPMESRIASMMFHGDANKAIAQSLRISENTVKHHITSIYDKFNVKNRLEFSSAIRINRIVL